MVITAECWRISGWDCKHDHELDFNLSFYGYPSFARTAHDMMEHLPERCLTESLTNQHGIIFSSHL